MPDGKWGHSGFMEQNNIKGGDLAARLAANRPTGGVERVSENEAPPKRPRRAIASSELMSRAVADATGGSQPSRGRGAISVKGASGAMVEVRNLVQGTTAEDVQVCALSTFKHCGDEFNCILTPMLIRQSFQIAVLSRSPRRYQAASKGQ